jgi:hypothetical protein
MLFVQMLLELAYAKSFKSQRNAAKKSADFLASMRWTKPMPP